MKHLISTLLTLTLLSFAFTACDGEKGDQPAPQPNTLVGTWQLEWVDINEADDQIHLVIDYPKDSYTLTIKDKTQSGKVSEIPVSGPDLQEIGGLLAQVKKLYLRVFTSEGLCQDTDDSGKVLDELFYDEKGDKINLYRKLDSGEKGEQVDAYTITQDQRTSGKIELSYTAPAPLNLTMKMRLQRIKF